MLTRLGRPRVRRRGMVLLAGACTCSALAASPAAAATTIGDNLSSAPTVSAIVCGSNSAIAEETCTVSQFGLDEGHIAPGGLTAPFAGVVVRWRVRTGVAPSGSTKASARLSLVEGEETGGERESTYTALPLDDPGVHTYPTRLPIAAGEHIAIDGIVSGTGPQALPINHEEGSIGSPEGWYPALQTGEKRHGNSPPTSGEELLLNADVEPDADHDGYGDETQDECPENPALHSGCKALAPPVIPPGGGSQPRRDTTPPQIKLTYPPRQDFAGKRKVLVRVRSNEAATVVASGQLEVGSGPAKKGREIWGLTGVKRAVAAGAKTALRLRLPRKTLNAARTKLAAGQKTVVKVVVTATDAAGNRSGATIAVIRAAAVRVGR